MTSSQTFFDLVDQYVTGPMEAANYVKIGDYDDLTKSAGGAPLVAARPRVLAMKTWLSNVRRPNVRVLQVGFEGPGEADERWIEYLPGAGKLNLRDWEEELDDHADWDVWNDHVVASAEELERRLSMVGAAMRRGGSE